MLRPQLKTRVLKSREIYSAGAKELGLKRSQRDSKYERNKTSFRFEDREGRAPKKAGGCKELRVFWIVASKDLSQKKLQEFCKQLE